MPWWVWIIGGVISLAIEVTATRDFTLFCVGVSAGLVGLMTAFGVFTAWVQWPVFAALSAVTLFWVRDWLIEEFSARTSDFSNVLGEVATPLSDLPPYGFGKAELRGSAWSAHNASHIMIPQGRRCRVMKVKDLTLWILPE
jgi:membrane protein implicated in regulation of membrane protease activity